MRARSCALRCGSYWPESFDRRILQGACFRCSGGVGRPPLLFRLPATVLRKTLTRKARASRDGVSLTPPCVVCFSSPPGLRAHNLAIRRRPLFSGLVPSTGGVPRCNVSRTCDRCGAGDLRRTPQSGRGTRGAGSEPTVRRSRSGSAPPVSTSNNSMRNSTAGWNRMPRPTRGTCGRVFSVDPRFDCLPRDLGELLGAGGLNLRDLPW